MASRAPNTDRFEFERRLGRAGRCRLAGVDEAGRGPLAGPVVAAAVVLPSAWLEGGMPAELKPLNDSKQLSPAQREAFYQVLTSLPGIQRGVAVVDAPVIDKINILHATYRAMNLALSQLSPGADHALVDGRPVPGLAVTHTAIVQGDAKSYSIAAASVLAKVTRDRLMLDYDREWPEYGFAVHKGYGTAQHREALARLGPCPIHRRTFAPLAAAHQGELW